MSTKKCTFCGRELPKNRVNCSKACETEIAQAKINIEAARKHNMKLESRRIQPGDPDFEELCAKIAPLHRIKKTEKIIGILDEVDTAYKGLRRRENTNEGRG